MTPPFSAPARKFRCRYRPRQGPARGRAPVQRRRSGSAMLRTPRAALIPTTSGAGPGSAFPAPPHEDVRQGAAVSRCILGPAPQRGRRGKVPPHTIRRARDRSLPTDSATREAERRPFPAQKSPRPTSSPVVAPGSARPRLTGRYAAKVQKRRPPMSATTAATTFMTGSPRQAAARPLSFAGQVPNRIKLSAQSIFLKDHFFII